MPLTAPNSGAIVRFDLFPAATLAPRLVIFAGTERERILLVEHTATRGGTLTIPSLGIRSWDDTYVACVAALGGGEDNAAYTLEAVVRAPATPSEFEPNDDARTASALPLAIDVTGSLSPTDHDWYRITAGAAGKSTVTADGPLSAELELTLRDSAGASIARATGRGAVAVSSASSAAT